MKIICIGRNYANHAKELNNPLPSEPMFFLKPDSAVLPVRNPLYIPEWTSDLHYEVELIFKINRLGKYIQEKYAHKYYAGVGLGLDFTARDVQQKLKEKGHPWEKAKGFDGSAVVSKEFFPLTNFDLKKGIPFRLEKNGEMVQEGNSLDMLFSMDQILENVSQYMTLKIGDLIFTGTPEGVGKVQIGDQLIGYLEDQKMFKIDIK